MKAFDAGEYNSAKDIFDRLYEEEENKKEKGKWAFYSGECYRMLNDSKKAERSYSKALKRDYNITTTKILLADQMRENGDYENALIEYTAYKELVPQDPRGEIGIQSCKKALEWINSPTKYIVIELKQINSKSDDFCPSYADDDFTTVYFTSTRPKEDKLGKISPVSGMPFTDVYETRLDRQGEWAKPTLLVDTTVNSEYDDGATAFNNDKSEMYFTFCDIEEGKQLGCKIMKSRKKGGNWGEAQWIEIMPDSISVGHPSLSADGLELYFASRMSGGKGGSDIWKCIRKTETDDWSLPINLGSEINSPGDEMYPFIRKDGNLYFSSDYWEGMGGLDLFRAVKNEHGDWVRSNMMYPMNSAQDDFGIVFQGKKEKGLFTSGREKGIDDIYTFELPELKFRVEGKIIDKSTKKAIAEATVKLIGSDGTIIDTKTKMDGTYKFDLKQYTDYLVVGTNPGFLQKKVKFSTNNVVDDTTFKKDIELITISKPVEIPNIFYDFGKWTLNESSQKALDELSQLLEDNPNVTIELGAHTDMVGDSTSNMKLSMKRAESIITYLKDHGYDSERLIAKGYGESKPVVVDEYLSTLDTIFKQGQKLDEAFVLSLTTKELQEKVNSVNRRTELRILSTNYIPKPEFFLKYKKNKMVLETQE